MERGSTTAASAPESVELNEQQERILHRATCYLVAAAVKGQTPSGPAPEMGGKGDHRVMGCFVTLKRRGRLRGCCGALGQPMKLSDALKNASMRTATQDVRLPPVSPTELEFLDLSVSLLHSFRQVTARGRDRINAVEVGRYGLQIQRGKSSGLLLPVVAVEHGLNAEEFLHQVCQKAGLPRDAWRDERTRLWTFESRGFTGPFDATVLEDIDEPPHAPMNLRELQELAAHCHRNLVALLSGATPSYYAPGCPDGTVSAVALTVKGPDGRTLHNVGSLSLRPGVPVQTTLFSLCDTVAQSIRSGVGLNWGTEQLHVGLSVLFDPATHGTVADVDLRGFESTRRALLVTEDNRSVWVYRTDSPPDDNLKLACQQIAVEKPQWASVYSLEAISSETSVIVASCPPPKSATGARPPAVAGAFYPAEADQLSRLVDQLLEEGQTLAVASTSVVDNDDTSGCDVVPRTVRAVEAEWWPAVMVPHAGLRYSGHIAAAVLQSVKIPDTVIVITPKHTRLGAVWAVDPHTSWLIPGATIDADPQLARQLAAAIDGLRLDAAAHHQEHGIEVELPLIARLAPWARVVGMATGAGSLEECCRFAAGLADVMSRQEHLPLLVISSDMNHFATEDDNRRLDENAMQALETLDPTRAYETVVGERISMCGILPAVIVLETLRRLGQLNHSRRVAYGTSADVNGDKRRVVGYAGMLFG